MARYLRHRQDGFIYPWNQYLAENPKVEEVSEEVAFPERFIPPKQKGRKTKLALETKASAVDEPAVKTPPALAADAAKGLKT